MKILLLSQFFSTTRGGGEYVFSLIAKNLAKNGHKVWIITNQIEDEKYESTENIKILFVPPILKYKGGLPSGFSENIRYCCNTIMTGLDIIRKEKIDIIHSNNFSPALAGSILSSITGKPHITAIHDVFSLCGKNYWKRWGAQTGISSINVFLAPFFEKLIVKMKHKCIHTVSEATKEDIIRLGARKPIYVIHNSVESNDFTTNAITNNFQFVYVGRLVFYKNLEVVIRAVSIAKKSEPNIKLVIVGNGPHRMTLEELSKNLDVKPNIEFKGYVSSDEKNELIAGSVALVFPSLCEGFGLVILEAFAQNKPVLVSDIRPMSDLISNGTNGFVLDPQDASAWAEQILRITREPDRVAKMGKNGNNLLGSLYSQDLMYQGIMKMYQEQLDST